MGQKIRRSRNDRIFDFLNTLLMTLVALLIIYPLYFVVIASVSEPNAVYQGQVVLLPKGFTLEGYQRILDSKNIWRGYRNSLVYTVLGTTINVCLTLLAAYPLSRKDFVGASPILFLYTFTMIFSGGMIPTYMNIKELGLINTVWAMVLPGAIAAYNLIVARTFFKTSIPDELLESAMIDGCSNTRFFARIVLPLSPTLIAILVLFYGVGHWNAYFDALLYLTDEKRYPLQLVLRAILLLNEALAAMSVEDDPVLLQRRADLIKYGVIIVASLPLLVLYPFLQKYFVKGLMIGSIKG
ncbi:carbohydrate ABC transporter permease [Eubacteriales bacterium OttesenSCG-928-A19]|nr:carbohydrate ABC transporter permease [Eubacteriales bacterium OttesenSCG-928-A19]